MGKMTQVNHWRHLHRMACNQLVQATQRLRNTDIHEAFLASYTARVQLLIDEGKAIEKEFPEK